MKKDRVLWSIVLVFISLLFLLLVGSPIDNVHASPPETAHGAHATSGNGVTSTNVFLAEGYTGAEYISYIALNNVHDVNANTVYVRFYDCNGYMNRTVTLTLEPRGRRTISPNSYLYANLEFCTRVSGNYNVAAERTTYKGNEGSSSRCCANPGEDGLYVHCLAEGYVDSANGHHCYIALQNCTQNTITIHARFVTEDGCTGPPPYGDLPITNVLPYSRRTIYVNNYVGDGKSFATRLWSSNKFCAERTSYGPYYMHTSEGDPLGALDYMPDVEPSPGSQRCFAAGMSTPRYTAVSYISAVNYDKYIPLPGQCQYLKYNGTVYASDLFLIPSGIDLGEFQQPARRGTISYGSPYGDPGVMSLWHFDSDNTGIRHMQFEQATYRWNTNGWWGYSVSGNYKVASKVYMAEGYVRVPGSGV
ncbi:MAG: hypothetical protein AB1384_06505 [Actinomycetota bacterium]